LAVLAPYHYARFNVLNRLLLEEVQQADRPVVDSESCPTSSTHAMLPLLWSRFDSILSSLFSAGYAICSTRFLLLYALLYFTIHALCFPSVRAGIVKPRILAFVEVGGSLLSCSINGSSRRMVLWLSIDIFSRSPRCLKGASVLTAS
jgi:hypothetical protein